MTLRVAASLAQRSWVAVGDAQSDGRPILVLVPTGSTEQHGPHLPLETDSIIATAVARGVADRLAEDRAPVGAEWSVVFVAPTLSYGASGEHQSFPGTVSIGSEGLTIVLVELVRSISTWADRVMFVNGHGGNSGALAAAVSLLVDEGHRVDWAPCGVPGGDSHAGRTETSVMLHLDPDAVAMPRAVAGNVAPLERLMPELRAGGVAAVSATGILGDPTGANAAEGAHLLAAMVAGVLRRLPAGPAGERAPRAAFRGAGGNG